MNHDRGGFDDREYESEFLRFRIRGDAFSRVLSTTTPFTCQVILRAQNFARSRDRASRVHG